MSKRNKTHLLFPLAAAFALASPAVFAQSHGVGIGAGVNASAAARVPTQMPSQASAGMEMRAMQRAEPQQRVEPQKATPAIPATPATPAVPASKADDGKATPAEPATPATPAEPAANTNTDGKQNKKDWSALDTDGNGSLSVSEAASLDSLAKVFAKADADGNGELTGEEYKTWWAANAGAKAGKH